MLGVTGVQEEAAHTHRAAVPPGSLNTKPYLAQEDPKLESRSVWQVSDKPAPTLLPGHPFVAAGRGKLGQVDLDLMLQCNFIYMGSVFFDVLQVQPMTQPRAPKRQAGFADRPVSVYHKQSTAHLHSPPGAGQLDPDAPRRI